MWDAEQNPLSPHSSTSGLCAVRDPRAMPAISVVFLICSSSMKHGMGEWMGRRAGLRSSLQPLAWRGQRSQGQLLIGAVTEGMQNPRVGAEENGARGNLGHKSDNITRSYCRFPGPRHSMDSQGEPLGSRRSCRCRPVSGLCQPGVFGGRGLWHGCTGRAEEQGAELSPPRAPPAVAVQAALPVRAAGRLGLWL